MLPYIILLVLSASLLSAGHVRKQKTEACRRELEAAVYNPESCAFEYLQRLDKELRAQSAVFWQNPEQSKAVVDSFMFKYQVLVLAADPLGRIMEYPGATPIPGSRIKARAVARANVYGYGFNSLEVTGIPIKYDHTSVYWGPDGQMVYIILALLKENIPDICCYE